MTEKTTLTATPVTRAGVSAVPATAADGANGNNWSNNGRQFLLVFNDGEAPVTVSLDIEETVDGQDADDRTVSVAAGATRIIGPFPPSIYNDENGKAGVTYSTGDDVYVQVLKCTPDLG